MNFLYILLALFIFGILIFIHELGHFLVARWCGVKILEFSIGMGPKILSKKSKKSGTVYSLRLFPIGGFVNMLGENGMEAVQGSSEESAESDTDEGKNFFVREEGDEESQGPAEVAVLSEEEAKHAYCNQSVWKRLLISLAGPFMNVLLGFLLMLIIVVAAGQKNLGTTQVKEFYIVYSAEESVGGMAKGDYLYKIDGVPVVSFAQVQQIVANDEDHVFDLEVLRVNEERTALYVQPLNAVSLDPESVPTLFVSSVSERSGLQAGDEILKVNNVRVHTHYELSYEIMNQGYRAVRLTVLRNGERVVLENVLFPNIVESGAALGEVDFLVHLEDDFGIGTILKHTWYRSVSMVKMVYDSLAGLFSGRYGMEAVSGPVGITKTISDVAKTGILSVISLMSVISINLGVMNLLPFPALDGGHLMLYLIELIRRKPMKKEVEGVINFIGLIIILTFAVIISIKDIIAL